MQRLLFMIRIPTSYIIQNIVSNGETCFLRIPFLSFMVSLHSQIPFGRWQICRHFYYWNRCAVFWLFCPKSKIKPFKQIRLWKKRKTTRKSWVLFMKDSVTTWTIFSCNCYYPKTLVIFRLNKDSKEDNDKTHFIVIYWTHSKTYIYLDDTITKLFRLLPLNFLFIIFYLYFL